MVSPPRKDNVVRFRKPEAKPTPGRPGSPRPPADWRGFLRGREGWVGLVLIVVAAVVIVLVRRLG